MSNDDYTVRLLESDEAHDLTPFVTSLTFKDVDPGGYAGCTFDLNRKIDARSYEQFSDVAVFDNATGEQCGGGRLLRPGRGVDQYGTGVWHMETLGEGIAHAQERTQPNFYIDHGFDGWHDGAGTTKNRKWEIGSSPDEGGLDPVDGLVMSIQQTTVGVDAYSNADYYDLREYGRVIGGFMYRWRPGNASRSNSYLWGRLRTEVGVLDIIQQAWNTISVRTVNQEVDTVDTSTTWVGDYNRANYHFKQLTTTMAAVTDADYILILENIIASIRKDRDGNDIRGGGNYIKLYVTADEVVIDSVSRYCPRFDLSNARIDEGDYQHTTLKWPEGISTYNLFDYLMSIEPEFTWAAWERQDNGKWNFEWRLRDTSVRYEFGDAADCGFEFTGGEEERIVRYWYTGENIVGRYQALMNESAVNPFAGRDIEPTGTGEITVSQGTGWDSIAAAAAAQVIENSQFAATSARASLGLGQVVYDHYTGRWIKPHLIKAGYLGRVTNARPQQDTLNDPDQQDNTVILRVVSKDYSAEDGQAQLELNAYTLDEKRAIANLLAKAS